MRDGIRVVNHREVYFRWRELGKTGLRVVHIDFHCDMRGMVIDRPTGRCWWIKRYALVDQGNFLAHAIMDGLVSDLTWLHHFHGGREHDEPGTTVVYDGDAAFKHPHELLGLKERADSVKRILYKHAILDTWSGDLKGAWLDLDYDAFAHRKYKDATVTRLIGELLTMRGLREITGLSIARSPEYSLSDRNLYASFVTLVKRATGIRVYPYVG